MSDREAYYNTSASIPQHALVKTTKSSDALISWSAEALIKHNGGAWPTEDGDVVLRVNASADSRYDGGPSVRPGEAYYVSLTNFKEDGIDWQIVVVQKVECKEGEEVDEEKLACTPCVSPAYSEGGGAGCTICEADYYYNKDEGECKPCPDNSVVSVQSLSTTLILTIIYIFTLIEPAFFLTYLRTQVRRRKDDAIP